MNHTTNYQLNQWSKSDRVLMEDFNADNAKLDAALAGLAAGLTQKGNCQFVYGSYQGTGKTGQNNPNRLTFSQKPVALFVGSSNLMIAVRCAPSAYIYYNGSCRELAVDWGEKSVSWYTRSDSGDQMNADGYTYTYIALVEA